MQNIFNQIKSFSDVSVQFVEGEPFEFTLKPTVSSRHSVTTQVEPVHNRSDTPMTGDGKVYRVHVKKYMTEKGTLQFDFMTKWNNDVPMPFVIMSGTIEKETRGMYYMKLHGRAERTSVCMCCGKRLTNKISMLYGLGPECGHHAYINPFNSEEELNEHLDEVFKRISDVTWSGWVIKSAIKDMQEVKD